MRDLMFTNAGGIEFLEVTDSRALNNQIALFCICKERELSYDLDYGLPYDILLNSRINNAFKENIILRKINKYFGYLIKRIHSININKENRLFSFTLQYVDIFDEEVKTVENI